MIISEKTLRRLLKAGKAESVAITRQDDKLYLVVNRFDLQRTDHVKCRETK